MSGQTVPRQANEGVVHERQLIISRPLLISQDTIQRCFLNTDDPSFPDGSHTNVQRKQDSGRRGARPYGEWPKGDVELEVKEYLKNKNADYDELVPACLSQHQESIKKFRGIFGPARIADAINRKYRSSKKSAGCSRQAVSGTDTYKYKIQPLFRDPPQPPANWKPRDNSESEFAEELVRMRRESSGG